MRRGGREMSSTTFNSLIGSIDPVTNVVSPGQIMTYLKRTDVETFYQQLNFLSQAEQRICRESKNIGLETYVSSTFTPGVSVIPKPGRWRRNITFNFGTGADNNIRNQLYFRNYEYIRLFWPDPTVTGVPQYYSDYGYYNLIIAPTPDQAYPFEYAYLQLPAQLSTSNQTNWLTDYAPDVLFYAILLEAVPFLKNDERIPVWENAYARGLASLNNQDDLRKADRSSDDGAD